MDYNKLKLKSGLEIHQQLDTKKLFCNCPSYLRQDIPNFTIKRKLHKVAGETGEIDDAVKHEASLNKTFYYQGYNDSTCLMELDEEPPHKINQEALETALKIALLLNCKIYPISQIMRKTVINGSNTAGFQRTVLIAHNGFIETSTGRITIDSIALEEDSARIIKKEKIKSIFRLDRLGIPLIEIATAPTLKTPNQIKEAALKIGEILRACKVKRGIGTIRQDVNVSIKNHNRVEIKGFQNTKMFIKTIDKEIERQLKNIKNGKTNSEVRNALQNGETEFLRPIPGRARMYPETDLPLLKISREKINKLKKHLPKLRTEIKEELKKKGLTENLIELILKTNLSEFNALMQVYSKDANIVAKMITLWRAEIATKLKKSKKEIEEKLSEANLKIILEELDSKRIEQSDLKSIMEKIAKGESMEGALKVEKVSDNEVEEEISKIIKEKPKLRPNAYMGLIMAKFKGKLNTKKTMEIINRILK